MPELRKDPLLGRWVIVGTERVRRPGDFRQPAPPERTGSCVFCAGRERETPPELLAFRDKPDDGGWRVRVVPSRFPALRVEGDLEVLHGKDDAAHDDPVSRSMPIMA